MDSREPNELLKVSISRSKGSLYIFRVTLIILTSFSVFHTSAARVLYMFYYLLMVRITLLKTTL